MPAGLRRPLFPSAGEVAGISDSSAHARKNIRRDKGMTRGPCGEGEQGWCLTLTDGGGVSFCCAWGKPRLSQIFSIYLWQLKKKKAREKEGDGDDDGSPLCPDFKPRRSQTCADQVGITIIHLSPPPLHTEVGGGPVAFVKLLDVSLRQSQRRRSPRRIDEMLNCCD